MNTDELRYFIEAAREQNLSKAARILGTTQSTLSHAIRRLEEEFDCKLFSKSGKNLKLTPQGRKFSERAVDLIRNIHDLKGEVSSGVTPITGHFKVSGTLGTPAQVLAHALLRLQASSKSVIEITSLRSSEILKKVASKELDFGLCYEPQPYPHVNLKTIAHSQTVIVVRNDHPILNLKKDKRLSALATFPWAHPRHLPGVASCASHPVFSKLSQNLKVRYVYDSYDIAIEMLSGSDAWALLPKALLIKYPDLLKTVLEEYQQPINMVLVSHEEASEQVLAQLEMALKNAARLHGWQT